MSENPVPTNRWMSGIRSLQNLRESAFVSSRATSRVASSRATKRERSASIKRQRMRGDFPDLSESLAHVLQFSDRDHERSVFKAFTNCFPGAGKPVHVHKLCRERRRCETRRVQEYSSRNRCFAVGLLAPTIEFNIHWRRPVTRPAPETVRKGKPTASQNSATQVMPLLMKAGADLFDHRSASRHRSAHGSIRPVFAFCRPPHCLKKNGTCELFGIAAYEDSTHAGSIVRAPGPLSPPTMAQSMPRSGMLPRCSRRGSMERKRHRTGATLEMLDSRNAVPAVLDADTPPDMRESGRERELTS